MTRVSAKSLKYYGIHQFWTKSSIINYFSPSFPRDRWGGVQKKIYYSLSCYYCLAKCWKQNKGRGGGGVHGGVPAPASPFSFKSGSRFSRGSPKRIYYSLSYYYCGQDARNRIRAGGGDPWGGGFLLPPLYSPLKVAPAFFRGSPKIIYYCISQKSA